MTDEKDALPVIAWKVGDEFAAYHPQASHVDPDYRDGCNACHAAAIAKIRELEKKLRAEINLRLDIQEAKRELSNKHDREAMRWQEYNQLTLSRAEAAEARAAELQQQLSEALERVKGLEAQLRPSAPPRTPNSGHGHVFPRPDGMKARCGGPALCKECRCDEAMREPRP